MLLEERVDVPLGLLDHPRVDLGDAHLQLVLVVL
jgi:hypothetical protein